MSEPSARDEPIERALDGLAAEIAGETETDPAPRDRGEDADGPVARSELLRGAALLTGRGDLAQDATHVGAARARLGSAEPSERTRLYGEVLRAARSLPPDR